MNCSGTFSGGEPEAKNGYIDLDDSTPGLGLTIDEGGLERFEVYE